MCLRVGRLDHPGRFAPDMQIYTPPQMPWLHPPSEAPAFREYDDTETIWSPASLVRRKARIDQIAKQTGAGAV